VGGNHNARIVESVSYPGHSPYALRWQGLESVTVNLTVTGDESIFELAHSMTMSASFIGIDRTTELVPGPGCDYPVPPSPYPTPSPSPSPPPSPSPTPSPSLSPSLSPSPLPSPSPSPPPPPEVTYTTPLGLEFISKAESVTRHMVTWTYLIRRGALPDGEGSYYVDLEICNAFMESAQVCVTTV
jgi:hypothetical protein